MYAVTNDHIEIVKALLAPGAKVPEDISTFSENIKKILEQEREGRRTQILSQQNRDCR